MAHTLHSEDTRYDSTLKLNFVLHLNGIELRTHRFLFSTQINLGGRDSHNWNLDRPHQNKQLHFERSCYILHQGGKAQLHPAAIHHLDLPSYSSPGAEGQSDRLS
jgi:hypothetical protein